MKSRNKEDGKIPAKYFDLFGAQSSWHTEGSGNRETSAVADIFR